MVVIVDGGAEDAHPHSKDKVGHRLALLARNQVYGEHGLVCTGPKLKSVKQKNGMLELSFETIGSGLVLKETLPSAFEVSSQEGSFFSAQAKLRHGKILLSADEVPGPKYVRYGWKKWFVPTLFNQAGLPASPFRTDDFPRETQGRYLFKDL